jgi:hypothetical protein
MAKTAVVNPRRKRRSSKRRRRNPATSAQANPRRRRRSHRSYGSARRAAPRRRRRRNPVSPYASSGYRRTPNPFGIGGINGAFKEIMDIVPAGTLGITAARFGLKASGNWTNAEPGLAQALAIFLSAHVGGALVGTLMRSPHHGQIAKIAALSYGGDLFARMRLLKNSTFYQNNFSLAGMGDDEEEGGYPDEGLVDGFQNQSVLGEEFEDSSGDAYRSADRGWALAGMGLDSGPGSGSRLAGGMGAPQLMVGNDGSVYQLGGFQNQSALGAAPARSNMSSSFGYTP